jgi:predicted GIY-YIG superfamily endonuclease
VDSLSFHFLRACTRSERSGFASWAGPNVARTEDYLTLRWSTNCTCDAVAVPRRFVYILQCENDRTRYYTGLTSNVRLRLADHNGGRSTHTAKGRPWRVIVVVAFANERRAIEFEKYLKSGSGSAFAMRHLR